MAEPTITPWTLEVVPKHVDNEYWRSEQARRFTVALDTWGLANTVVFNVVLATNLDGQDESDWRAPLVGGLIAVLQLVLVWQWTSIYMRCRLYIQLTQRWLGAVACLRAATHPDSTLSLMMASAQGYLDAGFDQRALVFILLLEPGMVLLSTVNYNVPFKWHIRLFAAKLLIDLLGTAPLLARSIHQLNLEPHVLPWCHLIELLTTTMFSLAPPGAPSPLHPTNQAGTLCRSNPTLFVPTFVLVSLGGLLPMLAGWCLEVHLKRSFLRERSPGAGTGCCIDRWALSTTTLLILQSYAGVGIAYVCAAGLVKLWPADTSGWSRMSE
jgi:hypothetical protein